MKKKKKKSAYEKANNLKRKIKARVIREIEIWVSLE